MQKNTHEKPNLKNPSTATTFSELHFVVLCKFFYFLLIITLYFSRTAALARSRFSGAVFHAVLGRLVCFL